MRTVAAVLAQAEAELADAGCASPRADTELLAMHATGWSRTQLLFSRRDEVGVDSPLAGVFVDYVARRARREPLQHIIGSAQIIGTELAVGPGVFIPRPETELLIEWAVNELRGIARPIVVDLCAGSGTIALAVADQIDAEIYAVEIDPVAFEWLARNAHERGDVHLIKGDATDPQLLSGLSGRVDAVLSNPPYVPEATVVAPEVRADPHHAVFGGDDGLDVIRPMMATVRRLLRSGGVAAIEHDDDAAAGISAVFADTGGFSAAAVHQDLAGRDRFSTAVRH
ncbi:peptide chain release factor N(5)-glutamine methyltransferase [Corynebacterium sp. TAE3-ERU12]|uniref:peptide chain release factor N(5)-glutamine methyltransferase n=1 Tax=Corynebacterium sp. TAE3-ERU12 TaxID=2849491 RepID=UPI001C472A6D|nr:peptide chain release factor N(5)-glutamine methyltransferase [Corynebacterium sp. TAE3-ERU12]MBV7295102.1 peptide chain release factor N(5)-glutamine methyltransferase [Corynebacterium sp. TAE3-ERU12]